MTYASIPLQKHYQFCVNIMNLMNVRGIAEQVHIIPLGHEYDRAVAPFHSRKVDRAYVLAVPANLDLDPEMLRRQEHFTNKVLKELNEIGVSTCYCDLDLFNVKKTMAAVSSLIKLEKDKGNTVLVNMSACGRKTSYAATMAAMVHQVPAYYVSAKGYIGGSDAENEKGDYFDHGISIVDDFTTPPELLHNFKIMMPDEPSLEILKTIYLSDNNYSTLTDFIKFLHKNRVDGYEEIPETNINGRFKLGNKLRGLMNKTNRLYLKKLEEERNRYIIRKKVGKEYRFRLTEEGEMIVYISGLLEPPECKRWKN